MRSLSNLAKTASVFSIFAVCLAGCGAGKTSIKPSEYSVRHKAEERGPTSIKRTVTIELPDAPLPPVAPAAPKAEPRSDADEAPGIVARLTPAIAAIVPYIGFGMEASIASSVNGAKGASAPVAPFPPSGSSVTIDGVAITAPAGASVRVETEETYGAQATVDQGGNAKGPGMSGEGNLRTDGAPDLDLPESPLSRGGGGGGGAFGASLSAIKGLNFFHWCGGLALLVAVGVWWFGRPVFTKLALGLALVGVVSIGVGVAIADYPWVWLALLAALAAVGGYLAFKARAAQRTETTLKTVVEGVEKANGAGEPVKALIKQTAMEHGVLADVKATVTKAKAAIGAATK